jgi:Iap family predicted aminopeptidase
MVVKNHKWGYTYFDNPNPIPVNYTKSAKSAWICQNCRTCYFGPMKPRGADFYREIGILMDCQAQMVTNVMES